MTTFALHYNADLPGQWLASLDLRFSQTSGGTKLSAVKRRGPLGVQKAFYPEGPDCAHVYLLHPPAGIVSGDTLSLNVEISANAHALLTTPGANRFYKARETKQEQNNKQIMRTYYTVNEHAILEHLPQETLVYSGANAVNSIDVNLQESSVYMGWDIICFGLTGSNKPFTLGQFTQLNRIYIDNKLVLHDRIHVDQDNALLHANIGLNKHSVYANFICTAPALRNADTAQTLIDNIRAYIDQQGASDLISISNLNGVIVCRYLGEHSDRCKLYFSDIWRLIRPICCTKDTVIPRIWLT